MEKRQKNKGRIIFALIIALVLVIVLIVTTFPESNVLFSPPEKPILAVREVVTESKILTQDICLSIVRGNVANNGEIMANNITVSCIRSTYPMTDSEPESGEQVIDFLNANEIENFSMLLQTNCKVEPRFDCAASCENC
jgi:membrane-associated HD superfamily phosphohydrolase